MTVIKCPKGHHYEQTANPDGCPHCTDLEHDSGQRPEPLIDKTQPAYEFGRGSKSEPADAKRGRPMTDKDDDRTTAHWRFDVGEPVCGWLVCYEGMDRGRDYRIFPGRNSIGRAIDSAICIRGDESISRANHAYIFFELESGVFYMAPDQGRVGIFCNGKIVLSPIELKIYDDIRIGNSRLKFIPLCGENFRWKIDDKKEPRHRPDDVDEDAGGRGPAPAPRARGDTIG